MRVCASILFAVLVLTSAPLRAEDAPEMTLPEHHAEDASAAAVTAATLFANERFWPYQVALANGDGAAGVLIRVEPDGVARIDFGRDGLREVAIAETDLVERANRVRSGELEKIAPNFLLALGSRLVDSAGEKMLPVPYPIAAERAGFLCVFADPADERLAAIAAALAPLHDRHGVWTIFFPQGEVPDAKLRDQLRALQWPVPFVYDHLAEAYSRSLLAKEDALPFVMLLTREGRVLYESTWSAGVASKLGTAIDDAFGEASARVSTQLPAAEALPATRLPLRLLGTVASADPAEAFAAIEDPRSHEQRFIRSGETLLDTATVLRIERRRIVIQNGATREELALDAEAGPMQRASIASAARPTQITPRLEQGEVTGMQLSEIERGSVFHEIGIREGDTVTQVNGIVATNRQDSEALLRELTEASELAVNVVGADGVARTLTRAP